jgi:hypothetical protein
MDIKTNHKPRPTVYGWELTDKERAEFDYLDDINGGSFFRYKGAVYDLGEFMRIDHVRECLPETFTGWHGYQSDTFFSGLLVRYSGDFESVVIGQYFS